MVVNNAEDAGIIAREFLDNIGIPMFIITDIKVEYDEEEDEETWIVIATTGKYKFKLLIDPKSEDVLEYSQIK